jgi:hypothetical protein
MVNTVVAVDRSKNININNTTSSSNSSSGVKLNFLSMVAKRNAKVCPLYSIKTIFYIIGTHERISAFEQHFKYIN